VNPNNFPLTLEGVVWSLDIEGRRVITGAGNSLPVIAAYSEGQVRLQATASIFNATRVIIELARQNNANVDYVLEVTLDPNGLRPKIHVKESGTFSLNHLLNAR
jgi:LEA14-like dessication related protein